MPEDLEPRVAVLEERVIVESDLLNHVNDRVVEVRKELDLYRRASARTLSAVRQDISDVKTTQDKHTATLAEHGSKLDEILSLLRARG